MVLAELIIEKSELKKRAEDLKKRIITHAKIGELLQTYEDPEALIEELSKIYQKLEKTIVIINRCNYEVENENGLSLIDLIAKRQSIDAEITSLKKIYDAIFDMNDCNFNYSSSTKYLQKIDIKEFMKKLDRLQKESLELNITIQKMNWDIEVD